MANDLLYLPPPYGFPNGTSISIQTRDQNVNGDIIAGVTAGYGCPPFILPNVSAAIKHSGRYDCSVTLDSHSLTQLKAAMNMLNVDVYVQQTERKDVERAVHLDWI